MPKTMHELGLMTGVMDAVTKAAEDAGADKVVSIALSVGEMTEAVREALEFAFEALSQGTICEGAELQVTMISPRSRCLECGSEYGHDRFHMRCPECDSPFTELLCGRELQIDSIEVYTYDDEERAACDATRAQAAQAAEAEVQGRAPSADDAVDQVAKRMADHILEGSE